MAERLFIAQSKLESWIEKGEVTFQDNLLTLLADKVAYRLEPAVVVQRVLDGQDSAGLLAKTITVAELEAQGAEHFQGSIILGETAYECDEGFMGTAEPPLVVAVVPPPRAPVAPLPRVVTKTPVPPPPTMVRPPAPVAPQLAPVSAAPAPRPPAPPAVEVTPPRPEPASARPAVSSPVPASVRPPLTEVSAPAPAEAAPPAGDNSADLLAEFMLKHM